MKSRVAKDISFDEVLSEDLKDAEFKAAFDEADLEARVAIGLAKAREAARITQGQLAARAHMKRQAINRIETKGQNLTLQTHDKICHALGFMVEFKLKKIRQPGAAHSSA